MFNFLCYTKNFFVTRNFSSSAQNGKCHTSWKPYARRCLKMKIYPCFILKMYIFIGQIGQFQVEKLKIWKFLKLFLEVYTTKKCFFWWFCVPININFSENKIHTWERQKNSEICTISLQIDRGIVKVTYRSCWVNFPPPDLFCPLAFFFLAWIRRGHYKSAREKKGKGAK